MREGMGRGDREQVLLVVVLLLLAAGFVVIGQVADLERRVTALEAGWVGAP